MKTDKISFGTTPQIGWAMADIGLPKYKKNLTYGILDAFQKLSKNNTDDFLKIVLSPKADATTLYTDSLELHYAPNGTVFSQSSKAFSPRALQKFSAKKISKIIIETYEKLKTSKKQADTILGATPYQKSKQSEISKAHKNKINKLVKLYSFDDGITS